jgi:lipid II:glycine glycyltransferase (peptidoglycan interpeptide bridge formation enzyme)
MSIRASMAAAGPDTAASFLQSDFWGDFKSVYGWKALRFDLEGAPHGSIAGARLLVLVRSLPGGLCFAYVPHGPELDPAEGDRATCLAELSEALRPFLPKGCLFLRFDPPWYAIEEPVGDSDTEPRAGAAVARPAIGRPLVRAAADVQPPDTVLVGLGGSEEEILGAMKSKWRYNVRLAEKRGVIVEQRGGEAVTEFYSLYRATSERDKIALHPEAYYRRLFGLAEDRREPDLRLWIARCDGQALAAIVTLFRGERAVYLYGASSDEKRNLMPAYALQWAAMRAAKAAGCLEYDLFGIPPTADPDHPMAGLYRFKTGFGGKIAHRAGSWDYPLRGVAYSCFRAAEAARAWYYKDFRKRLKKPRQAT